MKFPSMFVPLKIITFMKKIFTTLFMVMGIYTITHAQNKSNGSEFGVGIGYNASYVTSSNQSTDATSGLNIALHNDFYFSDRWSLKVKAVYDQKGWAHGFLTVGTTNYPSVDYKLNYITVPVMANWHFGKTRNWYLNFGPYIGFLMNANAKIPNGNNVDVKPVFNTVDGGLDVGIGIKFPVSNRSKFYIEYDGQSGVGDIFQSSTGGDRVLSTRASFNIGLTF
jgi:hypothetical protein